MTKTQAASYNTLSSFKFSNLSRETLEHMHTGMLEMLVVVEEAAATNYHILASVIGDNKEEPFTQWQHYPAGDVEDTSHGALWFYHAHEEDKLARPWQEHGHFHLFSYSENARKNAEILALPEDPDVENGGLCHLIAVSFSREGIPINLFTVNRWVAREWLYDAKTVIGMLDTFAIDNPGRGMEYGLTSRWLCAMLKLYRPQIEWALHERDAMISRLQATDPDGWSEDENIEVLSAVEFDFAGQIQQLERTMAA